MKDTNYNGVMIDVQAVSYNCWGKKSNSNWLKQNRDYWEYQASGIARSRCLDGIHPESRSSLLG